MESINSKLRVTLIESTLLEDQQSKFKSMIKNLKDWIKKIYDIIDKVRKPFRDYEEEIDDLIDHLRKNAKSSSVSESSDGYRDAAEYRMAQTAFSKSDNVFKIYLQISNFIVKDIGRTLGSIKRSIKMCEQAILDRERAERDREAERVGRANSNKMVEVGKNPKKIPFSKKFKIYSVVIGGTLYRVSKQFTILFEVTSIAITAGIIKTIIKLQML